jgi:hypothetical protein
MINTATNALKIVLLSVIVSGCNDSKIILEPELADKSTLLKNLKQYQTNNPQKFDELTIELNNEHSIIVRGNSQQVRDISQIASMLDQPASYYLEISNTNNKRYSSRNYDQSLQVLISPGNKIIITQSEWQSSPWRHYRGIESNNELELELKENLQLAISTRNNSKNSESTLTGQYQLQEKKWIKLMDNQKVTQNKVISTRNKKQLWLRLHPVEIEVDNQSMQ